MANLGHKLAEARNRKGISIREASESTKIRGDYLTRFENDDFEVNLPPVYLRGFLTNYARYLDLDPEGILADFDALQPADKRRPRKAFGAIAVDSPTDEGAAGDSQPQPQGLDAETVFPWLKVGLALGSILILTIITILIAQQCSDEDPLPSDSKGSRVDEPGVTGETASPLAAEQAHVLKLIVTGPIKTMFIRLDSSPRQPLHNLKKGDVHELKFNNSYEGAASSLENLTVELDGKLINYQGEGALKFSWPPESPKKD